MGAVWKARDAETGDVVALKILYEHLARDAHLVERFQREVEVTRRIDSPLGGEDDRLRQAGRPTVYLD